MRLLFKQPFKKRLIQKQPFKKRLIQKRPFFLIKLFLKKFNKGISLFKILILFY